MRQSNQQRGETTATVVDPCIECGLSTAFGSGRFVNRLPADGGWWCIECIGAVFDCDRCGEAIPFDEDVIVEAILGVECDADNLNNPRSAEGVRVGPCCAPTD